VVSIKEVFDLKCCFVMSMKAQKGLLTLDGNVQHTMGEITVLQ
jgi:hypothetical protein